jgi:hypothetical protein
MFCTMRRMPASGSATHTAIGVTAKIGTFSCFAVSRSLSEAYGSEGGWECTTATTPIGISPWNVTSER